MADEQLTIVVSEHLSEEACAWLEARARVVRCSHDDDDFEHQLAHADGLVVRTYTIVDGALLAAAPKLRVVGRAGAGLDNIDVEACRARGVEVVYRPNANTQAVVEYVLCLLGDALRPRAVLNGPVDDATWRTLRADTVGRRQMSELTLGILGLGRIGKRVAQVATAIGMRVIYNDLLEIPLEKRYGAEPVDVRVLFSEADVVSVHVDGRSGNRHFVGEKLLECMKDDSVLLNTSRGFVVDNEALSRTLQGRPEMLALLDVHDPEPFGDDYPLLGLANVRLYPHLASRTEWAMREMSWVVRDVMAVLEGRAAEFAAPVLHG